MSSTTYQHKVTSSEIKETLTKINLPLGADLLGVTAQGASRLLLHYKFNPLEKITREREFITLKEDETYESPYALCFVAGVTRTSGTLYIFEIL